MKNALKYAGKALSLFLKPIKANAAFFVFMYTLGLVCVYVVVPPKRGYHPYALGPQELFFDVYALCVFLTLLPMAVRRWVRRVFYAIAYIVAIVDVYCFVKFDSTLTPTMLLLLAETDSREAWEFLRSYITPDIIFSRLGWVLLVMVIHLACTICCRLLKRGIACEPLRKVLGIVSQWLKPLADGMRKYKVWIDALLGTVVLSLLIWSAIDTWHNKPAFARLMSYDNIGSVEHELTRKDRAFLYQPIYRLVFSVYANSLTAQQVDKLVEGIDDVKVDSCSFRSPNIVLIIGESFNRHHAQLYGYDKPTTPCQKRRADKGELTVYSDVVAPWNLTSFVFKHLFSTYTVGDKGEWCDYPLFPELFRKAGYHVSFLTNQFLPQAKEAVYDFSGGFFLNNPQLSEAMFDTRNSKLFYYDEGLVNDYDRLKKENGENNLIIFHLKGQHVDYHTRFPKARRKFNKEDYNRPDLNVKEKRVLANYDNAIHYNDSVVDAIIGKFEHENAVVIYVPDHGEECYGEEVHFYGRMHSAEITARLAREEFDIPFWIWCSHDFMVSNPDIYRDIVLAKDRPYMTDALPHLLLYLGGIHCPAYREDLNILSPQYNEQRPRILKNTTDYDKIMDAESKD